MLVSHAFSILAAVAAAAGAPGPVSQASITISVSVAPRAWVTDRGTLCSNLAVAAFGLRDGNGRRYAPVASASDCGAGSASRLDHIRAEAGGLLIIVAE